MLKLRTSHQNALRAVAARAVATLAFAAAALTAVTPASPAKAEWVEPYDGLLRAEATRDRAPRDLLADHRVAQLRFVQNRLAQDGVRPAPSDPRGVVNAMLRDVNVSLRWEGTRYDSRWRGRIISMDAREWVWEEQAQFANIDAQYGEARRERLTYRVRPQDLRVSARVAPFRPGVDGVVLECCRPDCIQVSGYEDSFVGSAGDAERFVADAPVDFTTSRTQTSNYWLIESADLGGEIAAALNATLMAQGATADCRVLNS